MNLQELKGKKISDLNTIARDLSIEGGAAALPPHHWRSKSLRLKITSQECREMPIGRSPMSLTPTLSAWSRSTRHWRKQSHWVNAKYPSR